MAFDADAQHEGPSMVIRGDPHISCLHAQLCLCSICAKRQLRSAQTNLDPLPASIRRVQLWRIKFALQQHASGHCHCARVVRQEVDLSFRPAVSSRMVVRIHPFRGAVGGTRMYLIALNSGLSHRNLYVPSTVVRLSIPDDIAGETSLHLVPIEISKHRQ